MDESSVERIIGSPIVNRRRLTRGYTPAERWVVQLEDGRSAFVKAAVNDLTAMWLRKEYRLYAELRAAFMPELIAWTDDGGRPVLILEDLSACLWPSPWTDARVDSVLTAMAELAATPAPAWLSRSSHAEYIADGWARVAANPKPLVATGIVPAEWLESALSLLMEAASPGNHRRRPALPLRSAQRQRLLPRRRVGGPGRLELGRDRKPATRLGLLAPEPRP